MHCVLILPQRGKGLPTAQLLRRWGFAVSAAVRAAEAGAGVILVGDEAQIRDELSRCKTEGLDIHVVHASQVVGMDEKPSDALRRKKDSSIQVACNLVRDGQADGVISAGHSGATLACAMFTIGRAPGVERPALATFMPTEKSHCVIIDVGANVDCRPIHLFHFGVMAHAFALSCLGAQDPKIGLLSIGQEGSKGNEQVRMAHDLFKTRDLQRENDKGNELCENSGELMTFALFAQFASQNIFVRLF
jgi:glycerol-3-phosphate acyltransferase PlsX